MNQMEERWQSEPKVTLWQSSPGWRVLLVVWTFFMIVTGIWAYVDEDEGNAWRWLALTALMLALAWWGATTRRVYDPR